MTMMLMPCKPGVCQECCADHKPTEPHNRDSLFYQVAFHNEHGRYPTWKDAMAHCDEETQEAWRWALEKRGIKL